MRRVLVGLLIGFALSLAPTFVDRAEAQTFRLGGHGLYSSGLTGDFGLGARIGVGIPFLPVELQGIYDYRFPDCPRGYSGCSGWTGVLNVVLSSGDTGFYVGGGTSFFREDNPPDEGEGGLVVVEDWGLDLVLGVIFDLLPVVHPFGEVRYEWYDDVDSRLVLSVGLIL
jgi:hypothetical protein